MYYSVCIAILCCFYTRVLPFFFFSLGRVAVNIKHTQRSTERHATVNDDDDCDDAGVMMTMLGAMPMGGGTFLL